MAAMGVEDLTPGKFAENITTLGIALHTLAVGTRLMLGNAEVEVSQIGKNATNIARYTKGWYVHHAY